MFFRKIRNALSAAEMEISSLRRGNVQLLARLAQRESERVALTDEGAGLPRERANLDGVFSSLGSFWKR